MKKMDNRFEKERQFILDLAKKGVDINLNLSTQQKKYIKNLLLFALMNASTSVSEEDKSFIDLVNKLFKTYLIKILKETLDDDDDDWDEVITVELNKIIASKSLKNLADLQEIFTPSQIFSFLKKHTSNAAQKDLLLQMKNLRDSEKNLEEKKQAKKRHETAQKDLLIQLKALRDAKINHRETPEEARKREQNRREYLKARERQKTLTHSRGERTR